MKKKNIAMILSVLAVVLVVFAACGKKDKKDEPVTVTDANGNVYEQVTDANGEEVTEIVTRIEEVTNEDGTPEVVTEIVTEIVTNAKGEKVTKKDGTPETVTKVETVTKADGTPEVVTEVVTEVEKVTKPYTADDTTKKGETSAAAQEDDTDFDTNLLGGGTPVEVPTDKDGRPTDSKLAAFLDKARKSKQLMLKLNVSSEAEDMKEYGSMAYTFYTKDGKVAADVAIPGLGAFGTMRAIINGNQATINFGKLGHFTTTLDDAEGMGIGTELFDAIAAEGMDYKGTTRVKDGGKTYDCETYSDGTTTNKYYFNTDGKLVRVEIIDQEGNPTVMKVTDYSFKVDDKEFEPVGKELSESDFEALLGGLT